MTAETLEQWASGGEVRTQRGVVVPSPGEGLLGRKGGPVKAKGTAPVRSRDTQDGSRAQVTDGGIGFRQEQGQMAAPR